MCVCWMGEAEQENTRAHTHTTVITHYHHRTSKLYLTIDLYIIFSLRHTHEKHSYVFLYYQQRLFLSLIMKLSVTQLKSFNHNLHTKI